MAKSKNHTAHNQSRKDHRNGLRKPSVKRHMNMKGKMSYQSNTNLLTISPSQDATPSFWRIWSLLRNTTWTNTRLLAEQLRSKVEGQQWWWWYHVSTVLSLKYISSATIIHLMSGILFYWTLVVTVKAGSCLWRVVLPCHCTECTSQESWFLNQYRT